MTDIPTTTSLRSSLPEVSLSEIPHFVSSNLTRRGVSGRKTVGVISSANLGLLGQLLKKYASISGVELNVEVGSFDNPIDDAARMTELGVDIVLLVPFVHGYEISTIQDGNQSSSDQKDWVSSFVAKWKYAADVLRSDSQVVVCLPHAFDTRSTFGPNTLPDELIDDVRRQFVEIFSKRADTRFIDLERLTQRFGALNTFDTRMYYRGKTPYSNLMIDQLAKVIWLHTREFGQRYLKALVVDGDNTLWGGIVGEDGIEGVKIDPFDYPGNIFSSIQRRLKRLKDNGILLCLATKNEPSDVMTLLNDHVGMELSTDDFAVIKIGWDDKPLMLKQISSELNIGLDSMAFLDDSPFECEAVASQCPGVVVFQVPDQVANYPAVVDLIEEHFEPVLSPQDGGQKTEEYRVRREIIEWESRFASNDDYLASLNIQLRLVKNEVSRVARLAELSQKTNQFNLTTPRFSEGEVLAMMHSPDTQVWSCHVRDRFMDHGLTGLVVVRCQGTTAEISAFMLSCRVLGRKVEQGLLAEICEHLRKEGITRIQASYVPTSRNAQTSTFFNDCGFGVASKLSERTDYVLSVKDGMPIGPHWITVELHD